MEDLGDERARMTALCWTERLRTGTFFRPPEGKFPVPYYRLEGSAIAI